MHLAAGNEGPQHSVTTAKWKLCFSLLEKPRYVWLVVLAQELRQRIFDSSLRKSFSPEDPALISLLGVETCSQPAMSAGEEWGLSKVVLGQASIGLCRMLADMWGQFRLSP